MLGKTISIFLLLTGIYLQTTTSYSARRDARIIEEYKKQQQQLRLMAKTAPTPELNHAQIARKLVHQATWAAFGTISVNDIIKDYPMVNIISVNDNDQFGHSTGHINFLLTDLDFTGLDWKRNNMATLLFSDEQSLHCSHPAQDQNQLDPMEPTCARTIISGQVDRMNKGSTEYDSAIVAFVERHSAAKNWLNAHVFYLCQLNITNIFVLDYYGGPHIVNVTEYYNTSP